ncbi:serine/threonine-protein kinase par-1 isoform X4 [Aedes aegypti]|uniref:Protein kinase domain-containing protein n=1 Tax=Aedes aegypti TaxID=7159 RepID=A0A6I8TIA7_AEDAE|nr:serine/threonine-protein kinase par-1 isoform X4 [Aedes aegypti]
MVIGESTNNGEAVPPPQQFAPQKATIENIMSGIENTGTVKMNNHRKKLRQRFDIIKKLGQGTYGKVQLGINKETGQEVAIKTIKKSKIETEADLIRIRREVQIMSSVQHPNIIHIYEVFENREKMVLVMEFAAGGELYDYLSERKVLSEEEARRIFRQVATAIYYCHKHKICHRDLKLENILLDENGHAKIADFGLSNVFDEQRLLATFCGSPLYASPEIVKGTPYLGPEVDCWSLGVLLYTLVYGAMPFDGANFKRLVKQISQGDYFEPKKPSRASPLIREMLTVCPQRRANIEQICNHWWVNEGYEGSCLDLAEELANQTPVRLDVLLSLAPPSVTSDQVVVGSGQDENKPKERIQRSHSVGSIIDMGATEAERRILDMVAAGGEAALMPSPTRTITPSESSPAQPKRKLEPTVSTENATGAVKKKEKASDRLKPDKSQPVIPEDMDVEQSPSPRPSSTSEMETLKSDVESIEQESIPSTPIAAQDVLEDLQNLENMCDELLQETATPPASKATTPEDTASAINEAPPSTPPTPKVESPPKTVSGVKARLEKLEKADKQPGKVPYKKVFSKNKTVDLSSAINQVSKQDQEFAQVKSASNLERKNSLPEENLTKPAERRKSRILETAEKFQNMNNQNNDKFKKFSLPGIPTVGNYKKEFERKASMNNSASSSSAFRPSPYEMTRKIESEYNSPDNSCQSSGADLHTPLSPSDEKIGTRDAKLESEEVKESDSKSSVSSFSLEEARRSMENSIAMLSKVRPEANTVDQLCAKTETVSMSDVNERERKLKNAREIISNAIPIGRLRKPPMPFGANGRSATGGINLTGSQSTKQFRFGPDTPEPKFDTMSVPRKVSVGSISTPQGDETKTSHAEITLKSATLPRRKIGKVDVHGESQTKAESTTPAAQPSSMRFSTEMQHQMPDLRSAPIREHPISFTVHQRANSLEPQIKEHTIPIQKPPTYQRTTSNAFGSSTRGSLSRQSTNESNDSDTTASQSQIPPLPSSVASSGATMPIKKSPREFIIPIAVEGGGFVTPRANSLEPSESSATTTSTGFGSKARLGRPRKISSLLSEKDPEEESSFPRLNRHTSLGRESDSEEPRFHTMHRLRSSRPSQRGTVEPNDSASSGEEDDDDGFEILTAENLFSTLLSRVRALTNRLNVNEPNSSGFPSSRFMSGLRQNQPSFWHHHDPFSSPHYTYSYRNETIETKDVRLNGGNSNAWRHSMSRDLSSDIDSMFSRSGATLPREVKNRLKVYL